jgi:hypothetical protein
MPYGMHISMIEIMMGKAIPLACSVPLVFPFIWMAINVDIVRAGKAANIPLKIGIPIWLMKTAIVTTAPPNTNRRTSSEPDNLVLDRGLVTGVHQILKPM